MNAAQRLYEEYQAQLKHLQETCPHHELTDWVEEWWAPGHSTGRKVRACATCDKVIQAKRPCDRCGQEFREEELRQGDGRVLPWGGHYCSSCYPEAVRKATALRKEFGPPHGTVAAPLDA
jgi:hypothetical protein